MATVELRRELGLTSAVMITVGSVIGSGIFLKPLDIARSVPSPAWIYGAWAVIGFVCLVFRRPEDEGALYMPHIDDLRLTEEYRGRGYGTAFIHELERIADEAGYQDIYISVEPRENPRAHALYRRLGYEQLQDEPYLSTWNYRTADGEIHQGSIWIVDMVKQI